jgi:hypothetical protein
MTRSLLGACPAPRLPLASILDTDGRNASKRGSGRVCRTGRYARAPRRVAADSRPRRSSVMRTCVADRGSRAARRRCATQPLPASCRSARPRSGHDARRRSGSPRSVWVELLGKKHRSGLQDLVRAPQLEVLLAKPLDLLTLLTRRQIGPQSLVGLRLTHPLAQRLLVDAQVIGDMDDRAAALSASLTPRSSSSSGYFLGLDMTAEDLLSPGQASWSRGPRQTRSGSLGPTAKWWRIRRGPIAMLEGHAHPDRGLVEDKQGDRLHDRRDRVDAR